MRNAKAIIVLAIMLCATQVLAVELTLQWTGHAKASGYRIHQSVDGGVTWVQAGDDIPQPTPFPDDSQVSVNLKDVPEETLVLFRASALREEEQFLMPYQGAWYDHRLRPPGVSALTIP